MKLQEAALQMGIQLGDAQLDAFRRYEALLLEWNQRFNLTSVTAPEEIQAKHFLDSLSCLLALPSLDDSSVAQWLDRSIAAVDVGAGAGFPGLPLKLVWPGLQLALVEATGKKCRFLEQVVAELKLDGVTVINARAEDFGQGEGRERFDLALGRAVSKLPTLLEYTLPLLRMGGCLIAQKGQDPGEELTRTRTALHTLGGSLHQVLPITVPGLEAQRTLVVVLKAGPTPAAYPRRAGLPQRQPLL